MYAFFERHLPRPFQYFKEQGFDKPTHSKPRALPFYILERTKRDYAIVKPLPANGPTGKFYQDKATGTQGSTYKSRKIILSQYTCSSIFLILMCLLVSKQPIPPHVLNEWERHPLPVKNGRGDLELDGEVAQGSGKARPKPRKGLNRDATSPMSADRQLEKSQ